MPKDKPGSRLDWCPPDALPGTFGKLRVDDLSPTQFAVGELEVRAKAAHLRSKHAKDPQHLVDYLVIRPVPVVLRDGAFYLTDHHHMARALHDAVGADAKSDLVVHAEVVANLSAVSETYFWKTMHARNWVYLFDRAGGGPRAPKKLPRHVKDLDFDPFRTLAWIVRSRHGYLKNDAPFSEFKWANFFRTRILLDDHAIGSDASLDHLASVDKHGKLALTGDGEELVEEAMFLATTSEARGLPGFRGAL